MRNVLNKFSMVTRLVRCMAKTLTKQFSSRNHFLNYCFIKKKKKKAEKKNKSIKKDASTSLIITSSLRFPVPFCTNLRRLGKEKMGREKEGVPGTMDV